VLRTGFHTRLITETLVPNTQGFDVFNLRKLGALLAAGGVDGS